jgi:hypothetical protein
LDIWPFYKMVTRMPFIYLKQKLLQRFCPSMAGESIYP